MDRKKLKYVPSRGSVAYVREDLDVIIEAYKEPYLYLQADLGMDDGEVYRSFEVMQKSLVLYLLEEVKSLKEQLEKGMK